MPRRRPAQDVDAATADDAAQLSGFNADGEITRPNAARVYERLVGGLHHHTADRTFCTQLTAEVPAASAMAHANAEFQTRATSWLNAAGIRQFLELGCGMPGATSLHVLLELDAPQARVVHVDNDPIAAQTTATAIRDTGRDPVAAAIHADLRDPPSILTHPAARRLLNLAEPIGLIATHVLHHLSPHDRPAHLLNRWHQATAAGSYLVLSHLTTVGQSRAAATYADRHASVGIPVTIRPRTEIAYLLADWQLTPPGLVWAPRWHPDPADQDHHDDPAQCGLLAAVAAHTPPPARPTRAGHREDGATR